MCGRFTLRTPAYKLAEAFGVEVRANLAARYNIAPSQDIAAIRLEAGGDREFAMARWGLVPGWARDPAMGNRMINARAETVAHKPAFRDAFRRRRCVIPADGFYEWQNAPDGSKQPYLIARPDGEPFAMAGLWERWRPPPTSEKAAEPLETCAIITTEANATVAPIHHRMPVILDGAGIDAWLGPAGATSALLRPCPPSALIAQAVGPHVNNARHDDPACIEPAPSGPKAGGLLV